MPSLGARLWRVLKSSPPIGLKVGAMNSVHTIRGFDETYIKTDRGMLHIEDVERVILPEKSNWGYLIAHIAHTRSQFDIDIDPVRDVLVCRSSDVASGSHLGTALARFILEDYDDRD